MKKVIVLLLLLIATGILIGVPFAGAAFDNSLSLLLPDQVQDPYPADWPDEPGAMPEMVGGQKPDRPVVFVEKKESVTPQSITAANIEVWYGDTYNFGQLGNPQEWVNIMGNVSDPAGIKSLTYKLNGGAERPLSMGTSNKRLIALGDFNIEFAYAELNPGANTVEIIVTNNFDDVTTKNVTVNYTAGVSWPLNYTADWSASSDIQDIAQVVDGNWSIQGGVLVPQDVGYDRLVTIGEETWTDYEVTMPFTVKGIDPEGYTRGGPGIGLIIRWLGHNQTPDAPPEQPRQDWERVGGIGWYRWASNGNEGLELRGRNWNKGISSEKVLEFNVPYMFKMSVQSSPDPSDERSYYRLKMWKQGDPEPALWDREGWSDTTAMKSGSVVVVAHFVDVEVGNVKIVDLNGLTYNITTSVVEGNGSIQNEPPGQTIFTYGEQVVVKAIPAEGYRFDRWTGDLSSKERVLNIYMTKDLDLKAHFVEGPTFWYAYLPSVVNAN